MLATPLFGAALRTAPSVVRLVVTLGVLTAAPLATCPAGAATLNVDTTVDAVAKSACDDAVAIPQIPKIDRVKPEESPR